MDHRGARVRAAWTALLAVLAVGLVWALLARGGDGGAVVTLLASTAAAVMAAVSCLAAARTALDRARTGWRVLAFGAGSWAAGNAYWIWQELVDHNVDLFPSPSDIGFLIFPLAATAGIWLIAGRSLGGSRLGPILDGLVVAGALFHVLWEASLRHALLPTVDSPLALGVALAYPIGDIVAATMVFLMVSRSRGRRVVALLLAAALLAMAGADTLFAVRTARGTYESGAWFDYGWVVGFLLFSLAARLAERRPIMVEATENLRRWQVFLPYVPFVASMAVGIDSAITGRQPDPLELAVVVVVFASLLARQLLMLLSHTALTDRLRHETSHDALTGLANRKNYTEQVDRRAALWLPGRPPVALLHVNLDNFTWVNDTLGQDVGDQLLCGTAERLVAACPSGVVARLGGDEFAILLEDREDPAAVACRIASAMREPFALGSHTAAVTVSIGVTSPPGAALLSGPELRKEADLALQSAKENGKDAVEVFEPAMRVRFETEMVLRAELERAVADGLLHLAYQPIVRLPSTEMSGVEALARWQHPTLGTVSPVDFIAVAERTGLIHELGAFILERACAEMAEFSRERDIYVSVNVSTLQLLDPAFPERVARILAGTGFAASRLILEVTESVLADEAQVSTALRRLRATGIRIAIDDFGTGYASLRYLHRFPADVVKIDRSYVEAVGSDPAAESFVRSLIQLFHGFGLVVVTEGVEDQRQADVLASAGSDLGQGYLWSRPVPPEELPAGPRVLAAVAKS